ncbi:MAG: helix-turn-helix transcriptional regulator [Sphingomonas sp.]|nr:helix-turn-helix transcriptional regulator [Sphingomonas sp.]
MQALAPGHRLRWPGGEAQLGRAEMLAAHPPAANRAFVAAFAMRDARLKWSAAPANRRLVGAGLESPPLLPLPASAEVLLVSLDLAFLLDAAGRSWHPNLAFRRLADGGDDVAWLIGAALREECREGGLHGPDYAARLGGALAVRLAERHVRLDTVQPLRGGLAGHRLRACIDHIERNLHRDIALAELAELAGLSTTHFARAFRRSLGEPPYRYFRRKRIERAMALLAETDQEIAGIARDCGYAAQSHFTSAFKLQTMTTPAAYRRSRREAV